MYQWIAVVGGIFSFIAAMGIGANDVANAYATAVGSRALSMTQAVVLATVFESAGAMLMGGHVTKTIRKGIADYECFEDDPGALMYGCMWVCFSVGAWLFIASKYEMPVSTTHSCVGGMIGMTIALKGFKCVNWYEKRDSFPYVGGVAGIVVSWVVSPVMSAAISTVLFGTIRRVILRSPSSFDRTSFLFPVIVGSTVTLNAYYVIYKGAKGLNSDETSMTAASAWSFGAGALAALVMIPIAPRLRQNVINKMKTIRAERELALENGHAEKKLSVTGEQVPVEAVDILVEPAGCCESVVRHVRDNLKVKLDDVISKDERVSVIHEDAEKFSEDTEEYFKYLQVFTAIFDSFSHGANDVANAIGPFAAIYVISRDKEVNKESEMGSDAAYGILFMGGVGIALGLVLYGYKIMKAIGLKLCKITPSRGSCIELGSAIVIITGSRLEIPLSTTHCQIGATMGVAALENPRTCSGVNCSIVARTIAGWVITLVVVGLGTAVLTAQGARAPEVGAYCEELAPAFNLSAAG